MNDLIILEGQDCLNYINKDIGFIDTNYGTSYENIEQQLWSGYTMTIGDGALGTLGFGGTYNAFCHVIKWANDKNKRIVGVVRKKYDDGGLYVDVYCDNQKFENHVDWKQVTEQNCFLPYYNNDGHYDRKVEEYNFFPSYTYYHQSDENTWGFVGYPTPLPISHVVDFDDAIDFNPATLIDESEYHVSFEPTVTFNDGHTWQEDHIITRNNPLMFGKGQENVHNFYMCPWNMHNPIKYLAGDLYSAMCSFTQDFFASIPASFNDMNALNDYTNIKGTLVGSYNFAGIPFNLILTTSETLAFKYLDSGILPADAYLYPLDWENLPKYDDEIPTGDSPEDYPDDNDPDDDDRDLDPTPTETPSFTVNQLTNYNWYWLTVPQWSDFINWFWNDIGDFSDFDDIIAKIQGLYNDLASAVIMCRYYPVDISWIGGLGTQSNIKIGMIEKAGVVDTISQLQSLRAVDIGHIHIGDKYKSFMDMSPYSQLSLYLPWHGFIDLDMNLFNGHDVYVKALYDYLSGTIQYYIYYDNEVMVNSILCKMAMDIPITLQTKNDRDSAIFNNVSSTIGGLVGAGVGIASGNPIGMTLGVTQGVGAINSSNSSAPMRLMGNVGESGAYIGCQYCYVIVRRPTIQPSDGNSETQIKKSLKTWKHNVGMLCGYGYTLSDLSGAGYTVCHTPRIDFKTTVPLQSEVDEIYDYLEKGVIL